MKWNILVIRGKENNNDSVSTGEGKWRNKNFIIFEVIKEYLKIWKRYFI